MRSTFQRRALLRAMAAASLLPAPFVSMAQGARFPTRPLTMIVPLPKGSAADISARFLADAMSVQLGQPVAVDNKPGDQFMVAMKALADAPADGYTLLHINPVMCAVQAVQKTYDLSRLCAVGMMGGTDMLIMASPQAPFKTLPDMLAWARANPGQLKYGALGRGSLEHLTMISLLRRSDITARSVDFKGGGEGAQALARGEVMVMPLAAPIYLKLKDQLVPLAVNQRGARSTLAPDVPTLRELQLNVPSASYWGGLAAAPDTPAPVLAPLEKALASAVESQDLRQRFASAGIAARFESAKDMQLRITVDLAWMGGVAQGEFKAG